VNSEEVLAALRATIDPDGEPYETAAEALRDLAPERAEMAQASELAKSVAEVLAQQPEYGRYPNMMIRDGLGGARGFQPLVAARLLVQRALREDADSAVDWLSRIIHRTRADGRYVMPLWRVNVERTVELAPRVELMPFLKLRPSFSTHWVSDPFQRSRDSAMIPGHSLNSKAPSAAIIERVVIDPLFANAGEIPVDHQTGLLDDVRLCLSIAGPPVPLVAPVRWFQFDDPELDVLVGGFIDGHPIEILPIWLPPAVAFHATEAKALISSYLKLPEDVRDRVRTSIQRLVQAMLRRTVGDKAADLSIALETLLASDGGGEHTWKVSTRAAALTGWDLQSALYRRGIVAATYRMRSALVHTGSASNQITVRGEKRSAGEVCEEAVRICAAVIRAIIERASIPDWAAFDVSGGAHG
jgi:hypothetical protein